MVKRKKKQEHIALREDKNIIERNVDNIIPEYMKEYAGAVIKERALPDIDGLKPVQRRMLYIMWINNLINGKLQKSSTIGGKVMQLHPHADASYSIYPMGAQWRNNCNYVFIDGSGGNITTGIKGASAPRYTSGTLTDNATYLLRGIKENAVDMKPSYDGEMEEPVLLPSEYPNVFMTSIEGIAVGMATKIIPHNPREIMDAVIYYMDHPEAKAEDYTKIIKGPDFPTGGILVDATNANLRELKYGRTGKLDDKDKNGTNYVVRGESIIDDSDKSEPKITFTSFPFDVTSDSITKEFNNFAEKHPTLGIKDLQNETSNYDDVSLSLVFKKGTPKKILEQTLALLYKETSIESTISPNNLMIANGKPHLMNIVKYFEEWFKFREKNTKRQFKFRYDKKNKRDNIVTSLLKLIDISDKVTKDARLSKNKADFIKTLVSKYEFNQEQADAIAIIPLYRLGKQDAKALDTEHKQLQRDIKKLYKLLNDEKAFRAEIKRQLIEIRDTLFKDSVRRTKLVKATKVDNIEIDKTAFIKSQDVVVTVKSNGVVQRMSQQVYDNNIDKYENKEMLVDVIQANTKDGSLFFTKDGLAYYRLVDEIENQNVRYDVDSVQTIIRSYKSTDKTLYGDAFKLDDVKSRFIVSITKQGMVKVTNEADVIPNTSTKAYLKRTTKYNGLKNKGDEVIYVKVFTKPELEKTTLKVTKNKGRGQSIKLKDINVQGASGSGSKKIALKDDQEITEIK